MPQALKQEFEQVYINSVQESSPKFQAYHNHEQEQAVLFQELLFFVKLSAFCVLTVASAFFLLSNDLPTLISLPLAAAISATGVFTTSFLASLIIKNHRLRS